LRWCQSPIKIIEDQKRPVVGPRRPAMTSCLSTSSVNLNNHRLSRISLNTTRPADLQIRIRMALKASLLSFFGTHSLPTIHLEPFAHRICVVPSAIVMPFCSPSDKGKPPKNSPLPPVILPHWEEKRKKECGPRQNSCTDDRKETEKT